MIDEHALNIYTDGSQYSKPRRGGLAALFVIVDEDGSEVPEHVPFQGYEGATNNQMELAACVEALKYAARHYDVKEYERIVIYTDSLYVSDNLNNAKFQWSKDKWRNRVGKPVANAELWRDLVRQIKKSPRRVEIKWVKGHSKNPHNKKVDKLAKTSAKGPLQRPVSVVDVRRKTTKLSVDPGCIPMLGQTLDIRIVTSEYLRLQKEHKYKCEVLSGDENLVGKVDWLFSNQLLSAGHHYEVVVNENQAYPQIIDVVRELERESSEPQEVDE